MWDSDTAGCERPKKHSPTSDGVVINTEWGAFGNTGSLDIIRYNNDPSRVRFPTLLDLLV